MEQRLTIITLGVSDLKVSNEFYQDVFGWKKTKDSNEHISFFSLNGILLALYPSDSLAEDATVRPEGTGFNRFTLAHNLRSEKEVDELFTYLKGKSVTVTKEPQKVAWGGYSGYISDPDGHLWEIAFNPFLSMDNLGNVSN